MRFSGGESLTRVDIICKSCIVSFIGISSLTLFAAAYVGVLVAFVRLSCATITIETMNPVPYAGVSLSAFCPSVAAIEYDLVPAEVVFVRRFITYCMICCCMSAVSSKSTTALLCDKFACLYPGLSFEVCTCQITRCGHASSIAQGVKVLDRSQTYYLDYN